MAGTSTKGPISDGDVKVYKLSTAGSHTEVACAEAPVKTRGDGTYTCTLTPNETGPFEIEITNGRYCDTEELVANCTGTTPNNIFPLAALVVSRNGSLGAVQATPFTSVALALARENLANDATLNFGAQYLANYSSLASVFGIDDNPTSPVAVNSRLATFLEEISLAVQGGLTLKSAQDRIKNKQAPRTDSNNSLDPRDVPTRGGNGDDPQTGQQNLNVITDSGTTTGATSSGSTVN